MSFEVGKKYKCGGEYTCVYVGEKESIFSYHMDGEVKLTYPVPNNSTSFKEVKTKIKVEFLVNVYKDGNIVTHKSELSADNGCRLRPGDGSLFKLCKDFAYY